MSYVTHGMTFVNMNKLWLYLKSKETFKTLGWILESKKIRYNQVKQLRWLTMQISFAKQWGMRLIQIKMLIMVHQRQVLLSLVRTNETGKNLKVWLRCPCHIKRFLVCFLRVQAFSVL